MRGIEKITILKEEYDSLVTKSKRGWCEFFKLKKKCLELEEKNFNLKLKVSQLNYQLEQMKKEK